MGGSLYFNKGEFVQTKNSFLNSTNTAFGSSFYIAVSEKPNYKNHANETLVYNCGSSEQECSVLTGLRYGFQIMNQCNITQNRVKKESAGYATDSISSDSYITCVNVIENNQSSGSFNWHGCPGSSRSTFKVTSCNYLRNKSPKDSYLISSGYSNVFMSYCCIRQNKIPSTFYAQDCTITFENSTTDNTTSNNNIIFKNTNIRFENECPLLKLDILDTIKNGCRHTTANNDEDEEDDYIYFKNHIKFFYFLMLGKRFRSRISTFTFLY